MLNLFIKKNILAIGLFNKDKNNFIFWSRISFLNILVIILFIFEGISNEYLLLLIPTMSINKDSQKEIKSIPTEFFICKNYLKDKLSNFIYDKEINQWYQYNMDHLGVWEAINEEDFKFEVIKLLTEHEIIKDNLKMSYLVNVLSFLKTLLRTNLREFSEKNNNLIPFNNGILNLKTGELLSFSPEFKFTSKLNIDYVPGARMKKNFVDWLLFISNNNPLFLDVLRSYIYLILTRNNSHQVSLYLHGPAGTGKSTFEKLMISIVSRAGAVVTDLKRINSNFETAKLVNKNLLLLSDINEKKVNVNKIKLIISGDMLAAERKFEQPFEFFPTCLVILSSNHIWEPEDISSGIMRRVIYLPFDNIPLERDPKLFYLDNKGRPKGKLSESLSGFINWILMNPVEKLKLFLSNIHTLNKELSPSVVKDTNHLLNWASTHLLYSEDSYTFIGNKKKSSETHLYPNYLKFCISHGYVPTSFNKFSYSLQDICVNQLGWKGVYRKELQQGMTLTNVILNLNPSISTDKVNSFNKIDYNYFNGFVEGYNIIKDDQYFKGIIELDNLMYTLGNRPQDQERIKQLKEEIYFERPYSIINQDIDDLDKNES